MDRVAVVPVVLRRQRGYLDVRCSYVDRSYSDCRAHALAKESGNWIQNCRRMASRRVYGPVGLPTLRDIAMSTFDAWIKKHHPELPVEFNRLPKAKKTQTFYSWIKENHPGVILKEWPAVARIRARHLRREVESE